MSSDDERKKGRKKQSPPKKSPSKKSKQSGASKKSSPQKDTHQPGRSRKRRWSQRGFSDEGAPHKGKRSPSPSCETISSDSTSRSRSKSPVKRKMRYQRARSVNLVRDLRDTNNPEPVPKKRLRRACSVYVRGLYEEAASNSPAEEMDLTEQEAPNIVTAAAPVQKIKPPLFPVARVSLSRLPALQPENSGQSNVMPVQNPRAEQRRLMLPIPQMQLRRLPFEPVGQRDAFIYPHIASRLGFYQSSEDSQDTAQSEPVRPFVPSPTEHTELAIPSRLTAAIVIVQQDMYAGCDSSSSSTTSTSEREKVDGNREALILTVLDDWGRQLNLPALCQPPQNQPLPWRHDEDLMKAKQLASELISPSDNSVDRDLENTKQLTSELISPSDNSVDRDLIKVKQLASELISPYDNSVDRDLQKAKQLASELISPYDNSVDRDLQKAIKLTSELISPYARDLRKAKQLASELISPYDNSVDRDAILLIGPTGAAATFADNSTFRQILNYRAQSNAPSPIHEFVGEIIETGASAHITSFFFDNDNANPLPDSTTGQDSDRRYYSANSVWSQVAHAQPCPGTDVYAVQELVGTSVLRESTEPQRGPTVIRMPLAQQALPSFFRRFTELQAGPSGIRNSPDQQVTSTGQTYSTEPIAGPSGTRKTPPPPSTPPPTTYSDDST